MTAAGSVTSSVDVGAADPLKDMRFLRDVNAKIEVARPILCQTLLCAVQALMNWRTPLTGQQVLTREETSKARRETLTFTQSFHRLLELTRHHTAVDRKRDIENEAVGSANSTSVHTLDML